MIFLEVEMLVRVVEVVVKVLVAMVERRGLPQDEFFWGTFSLLPPLHCPFSSLDLSLSPSLQPFWLSFYSFWVMELLVSWGLLVSFGLLGFFFGVAVDDSLVLDLAAAADVSVVVVVVTAAAGGSVVVVASAGISVVVVVVVVVTAAAGDSAAAAAACVGALVCF